MKEEQGKQEQKGRTRKTGTGWEKEEGRTTGRARGRGRAKQNYGLLEACTSFLNHCKLVLGSSKIAERFYLNLLGYLKLSKKS